MPKERELGIFDFKLKILINNILFLIKVLKYLKQWLTQEMFPKMEQEPECETSGSFTEDDDERYN